MNEYVKWVVAFLNAHPEIDERKIKADGFDLTYFMSDEELKQHDELLEKALCEY